MTGYQKICEEIGNESFEALWDSVLNKRCYINMPEYDSIVDDYCGLLDKIPDPNLKFTIEEKLSTFTSLAMYQGFVLGFKEAVKLIIDDNINN